MDNKPNQSTPGSASTPATPIKTTDSGSNLPNAAANRADQSLAGNTKPNRQPAPQAASTDSTLSVDNASALLTEASNQFDKARKSWLNQDELLKGVNQLPQSLKDLGSKAADQFNSLSTRQKVVGGALLVSGLSWLALRSKKSKSSDVYSPKFAKGESKWKSSNESVYRGASGGLHSSDTVYGTENGF